MDDATLLRGVEVGEDEMEGSRAGIVQREDGQMIDGAIKIIIMIFSF
jgi:hypothetical protein